MRNIEIDSPRLKKMYNLYNLHQIYDSHNFKDGIMCECGLFKSLEIFKEWALDPVYMREDNVDNFIFNLYVSPKKIIKISNVDLNKYIETVLVEYHSFIDLFPNRTSFIEKCKELNMNWSPPDICLVNPNSVFYKQLTQRRNV